MASCDACDRLVPMVALTKSWAYGLGGSFCPTCLGVDVNECSECGAELIDGERGGDPPYLCRPCLSEDRAQWASEDDWRDERRPEEAE